MESNSYLICGLCGGTLQPSNTVAHFCPYCGYTQYIANPQLADDLRGVQTLRDCARFEEAAAHYREMLKTYKGQDLTKVYWGLLLCEQHMLFETDEKGERFPSFYHIVEDNIEESPYYISAVAMAQKHDPTILPSLEALAQKATYAKQLYTRIRQSTKAYDVFICFKKTDDKGNMTADTRLAADLYNHFASTYNVFFSDRTLRDVVVRDYEPNIYYALYTAKVMLVLCSKKEYLSSQWVKNEWSRFLSLACNPLSGKDIIPIFMEDFSPAALPAELQIKQGIADDRELFSTLDKMLKNALRPADLDAELKARDDRIQEMQAENDRRMQQMQDQFLAKLNEIKNASTITDTATALIKIRCSSCGKDFTAAPGTDPATCTHCGNRQAIQPPAIPGGMKRVEYANGCYEGAFINGKRVGKGRFLWTNGNRYEGDFADDKRTGKGRFFWTDGDRYEGDFVDGKRTGKGKYLFANGNRYEGDFVDGKCTGKGVFFFANGDRYEGDFLDGRRTGKGTLYCADGNRYVGDFINDKPAGKGTLLWANGNRYEGDFANGKRSGRGTFFFANGDRYEGDFANGSLTGKGTFFFTSGDRYVGDFLDGKRTGYGTYFWKSGNRYEGRFVDGKPAGKGKLYQANGDVYEGEW